MIRATLGICVAMNLYSLVDTGNILNLAGGIIAIIGWIAYEKEHDK